MDNTLVGTFVLDGIPNLVYAHQQRHLNDNGVVSTAVIETPPCNREFVFADSRQELKTSRYSFKENLIDPALQLYKFNLAFPRMYHVVSVAYTLIGHKGGVMAHRPLVSLLVDDEENANENFLSRYVYLARLPNIRRNGPGSTVCLPFNPMAPVRFDEAVMQAYDAVWYSMWTTDTGRLFDVYPPDVFLQWVTGCRAREALVLEYEAFPLSRVAYQLSALAAGKHLGAQNP